MKDKPKTRDAFGSRLGFILAAAGSAVGLGNIWKFPYIAGENGGGAFVLLYLGCIALVGLPIMVAEMMIGRAAQAQPVAAIHKLQGKKSPWAAVGWMGVLAGFVILSFYAVVAGWSMDYTMKSVVNFTKPINENAEQAAANYTATASLEEMRQRLAEEDAKKAAESETQAIAKEHTPESLRLVDRFEKAHKTATESGVAQEVATANLLLDPAMRAAHEKFIEPKKASEESHQKTALETWNARPDHEVVAEASERTRQKSLTTQTKATFTGLFADGLTSTFWAVLFMAITILIVMGGVSSGIERTCRVLMPALMVLIVTMVIYGTTLPGFGEALDFVFSWKTSNLEAGGVLEALGHAFFTLSIGMGAMITYGSYQKGKGSLLGQSLWIAGLDTGIALLACMMMFPIIFSFGMEPGSGPGLAFITMPLAFAQIGVGGMLLSIIFFGLLVFAALTSAVSLLEVVCSYFVDEKGWGRKKAALIIGGVITLFAIPVAYTADNGGLFQSWKSGYGMDYLDTMDVFASNWLLPIGGLFISLYAGWAMPAKIRKSEMEGTAPSLVLIWLLLIRFVAPLLVLLVVGHKIGLPVVAWLQSLMG